MAATTPRLPKWSPMAATVAAAMVVVAVVAAVAVRVRILGRLVTQSWCRPGRTVTAQWSLVMPLRPLSDCSRPVAAFRLSLVSSGLFWSPLSSEDSTFHETAAQKTHRRSCHSSCACATSHYFPHPHRDHCFWGLRGRRGATGASDHPLSPLPLPSLTRRRPRLAASLVVSSHYLHSAWINLGRVAHNGGGLSPLCAGHRQSGPRRCAYYHRQ